MDNKAISLHIGVNNVDPEHYGGWNDPLACCERDADVMSELAKSQGFETTVLKSAEATREDVAHAIRTAAAKINAGGMFFLTFSGHGSQVKDADGDEDDGKDETWCLFDGQLLDDELEILWAEFAQNVHIFVCSDSCHSGTITKNPVPVTEQFEHDKSRMMPREASVQVFRKNRDFYTNLQLALPNPLPEIQATVRLFSGCQESQQSFEGPTNGRFTEAFHAAFLAGEFGNGYEDFHRAIAERMPNKDRQTPNHLVTGVANKAYDQKKPLAL